MKNWKRLFYYLIINVLVSACTVISILYYWERTHPEMPILSQINPFAAVTPLPQQLLFPNVGTPLGTAQPTELAVEATEVAANSSPTAETQAEMRYTVQSGDTLGEIAVKFNVTVAEILAANEIPNPDSLVIGQELIILRPLVSAGTHTALPSEETVVDESPTATQPASQNTSPPPNAGEARVIIDSVIGAGDLDSERVFLKRDGSGEISLQGWQLISESGDTFTFPQISLFESGALYIYSKSGLTSVVALYWELDHPVWEPGDTVLLVDNEGQTQATYQIP